MNKKGSPTYVARIAIITLSSMMCVLSCGKSGTNQEPTGSPAASPQPQPPEPQPLQIPPAPEQLLDKDPLPITPRESRSDVAVDLARYGLGNMQHVTALVDSMDEEAVRSV